MGNNTDETDDRRWTTLESETIISRPPWLSVRHDKVRLPDGRINPEFYVLQYPDWVNVIAITDEGKFVMEIQYRYGIDATCHEICAGVMEEGKLLSRLHAGNLRRKQDMWEENGLNL